ncbi:MAG TPA: cytochrome C [Gammaproteobacteria bacterium]|nr:cytochrome C [Gammaproteobacteria bacterium]
MLDWKRLLIMALMTTTMVLARHAAAVSIEKLLMPGPLVEGHARHEGDCSKCHLRFRKGTQARLCLDCHEKVDADIRETRGFHGRLPDAANISCRECHSDHLGRKADIVRLNPVTFDHEQTDFLLEGAHTHVACAACHVADKAWAEAPNRCFDCHKDDEPHKGNLGEQCDDCHTPRSWDEFEFDHDKTDFKLQGKHRNVACTSCHVNERYKETPDRCSSCHAINDVHAGANGDKCEDCHTEKGWSKTSFDHNKDTDFPLRGAHKRVQCESCHVDPVKDKKPKMGCVSCHKADDAHHGNFGRKCQTCHNAKGWPRARFDHDRKTDFPLTGKHGKLACASCHTGNAYREELATDCFSCHQGDDVHREQEGKDCARCHVTRGWADRVLFDHDLTRFPLLGLHAAAPCEECHLSKQFRGIPRACHECHEDDEHKGTLGNACQSCHNPNAWTAWRFDHDTQTDFKLDGAHAELACNDCHIKATDGNRPDISDSCNSCHQGDDVHKGRFGRNCARCHNTERFNDVQIQ